LPRASPLFPYTTLFRSPPRPRDAAARTRGGSAVSDTDALVAEALERLVPREPEAELDWRDVLRRAKVPRRRLQLALAAAAAAVVAATPALALSERLREAVGLGGHRGPVLVAHLGQGATVRLEAPGILLAHWKIIVV